VRRDSNVSRGRHDPALTSSDDSVRFAFGANWLRYIDTVDDGPIRHAERSIRELLGLKTLSGRRFLDAGSGSGLFSLAARRLGAEVCSFDFDENSVLATQRLKDRYFPDDARWTIHRGSVLDPAFLETLGTHDIVYSWGVLHHTGDLWRALRNVTLLVNANGRLCVAIYNDQGRASVIWKLVKQTYNRLPRALRFIVLWPAFIRLWGPTFVRDFLRGSPARSWSSYKVERGMSPLIDVKDWVGGYPFEVATPREVIEFFAERRFDLTHSILRNGIGCNEFAFVRSVDANARAADQASDATEGSGRPR
jgi:SAM-dependent methyltransferase